MQAYGSICYVIKNELLDLYI